MLQEKIISRIKSISKGLLSFILLLCLSQGTALTQVKKINLQDTNTSSGGGAYNLYQTYKVKKGKIRSYYYGFSGYKEGLWFGRSASFFAEPSIKVPFDYISSSLDNSTILGVKRDTLHVFDVNSGVVTNTFVVEGTKSWTLNNDGSLAFIGSYKDGNRSTKVIDTNTGEIIQEIPFLPETLRLSPDNRYLGLNMGESLRVYDLWEGGEPYVYDVVVVSKKKKSSTEFIRDFNITSGGLVAMSYVIKGRVKKDFYRIQHYAVLDIKTGEKVFKIKLNSDDRWYMYSLDPTGKVIYAEGKFYNVRTGEEIEVNQTNKKKIKKFNSWKFHPHIQGVYHAENGEGVIGLYTFE